MFQRRERALASLEPLCGRVEPHGEKPPEDVHHKGDLQDVRNRLGLLVPPSIRYMQVETERKPTCLNNSRQLCISAYMRYACRKRAAANKSVYMDPYGRDLPGGPLQVRQDIQAEEDRVKKLLKKEHRDGEINVRAQQLKEAVDEAQQKREEQGGLDAMMWGEKHDDFFDDLFPPKTREGPKVSPRLYGPRNTKPQSEWTKNMELLYATARRKDIQDATIRRLEKHDQHGDDVRIARNTLDFEHYNKLLAKISEKETKLEKSLQARDKP